MLKKLVFKKRCLLKRVFLFTLSLSVSLSLSLDNMTEQQIVDFDNMNFDQKTEFVIKNVLRAYNFTDPTATTLDWSSSTPGLYVPASVVLTVLQTLNINRICCELVGKKL